MRKQLCDALLARSANPDMIFLTGDLGFMALEDLQRAMGPRFINAGVSEQNMISVGAALARQSFETWAYSIAPFCYARPFEQIRNDVCFHGLPLKLIGNGGGYGYGVMGPTHHAIEDYGVLLTLQGMHVFVPVFDEDVGTAVERVAHCTKPSYLRLGRGEAPAGWRIPDYAPWRKLMPGNKGIVIAVGPLAGSYIAALEALPLSSRPCLWAVSELPLQSNPPPSDLIEDLLHAAFVVIAEEHVMHGSFGTAFAHHSATTGLPLPRLRHLVARSHTYDRYGSQGYLRQRSGLDPHSLLELLDATR